MLNNTYPSMASDFIIMHFYGLVKYCTDSTAFEIGTRGEVCVRAELFSIDLSYF